MTKSFTITDTGCSQGNLRLELELPTGATADELIEIFRAAMFVMGWDMETISEKLPHSEWNDQYDDHEL